MDKKSIGPSWSAVAERYKDDEKAVSMLARKIIEGGNGHWGKTMMAAHPQHNTQETTEMVRYILSLDESEEGSLPLSGPYVLGDHIGRGESGTYMLTASYTDKGNKFTGPLTGRKSIYLRNPKVQAEDFDLSRNVGQQIPHGEGVGFVSEIKDGAYIAFRDIDLKGINNLTFSAASGKNGGLVEMRLGAPSGKLIGSVKVEPTPDHPMQWRQFSLPLKNIDHRGDIFFVFRNAQVKDQNIMRLDWIYFGNKTAG